MNTGRELKKGGQERTERKKDNKTKRKQKLKPTVKKA